MNSKFSLWIVPAASLLVSFALYANTIGGQFVYDDYIFHTRPELREPAYLPKVWLQSYLPGNPDDGTYRPLSIFSFSLSYIVFGESPVSFHIVNILLNGLVVFLTYILIYRLFQNQILAALTALIFAFLPIHTEVVAYIKSRDELLGAVFALLAWLMFLKATEDKLSYIKLAASGLLFFISSLAKETLFILPALFLSVFWILQKPKLALLFKSSFAFLAFGFIYMLMRYAALGKAAFGYNSASFVINPLNQAELPIRLMTAFKMAFIYIQKIIFPANLSATHAYNHLELVTNPIQGPEFFLGILSLAILLFLIFYKKTRLTPLGLGALIFLIPYFMVSRFVFTAGELFTERWMYLPSMGISLIAAFLFLKFYNFKKWLFLIFLGSILALYSFIAIQRNIVWTSRQNLFEGMIRDAPNSIQGHLNLAGIYLEKNDLNLAKKHAKIASDIYEDHPYILNLKSIIAVKEGNLEEAARLLLKSKQIDPTLTQTYQYLAGVYFAEKRYQETAEIALLALRIFPQPQTKDIITYSASLAKLGKFPESLAVLEKYLGFETQIPQARFILAINLYKLGRIAEAEKYFDWDNNLTKEEKIKAIEEF